MKNSYYKFFIIFLSLSLLFGVVGSATMQEEIQNKDDSNIEDKKLPVDLTKKDIETTFNQLKVSHSGFVAVRDEFFADQSEGNKVRYHKSGQDWANQLIDANLQYIDYIHVDLYNQLSDQLVLDSDWLNSDREKLAAYKDKVDTSEDYVTLRNIMNDYNKDWADTLLKINQIKALVSFNSINELINISRQIHDKLVEQQQSLENNNVAQQTDLSVVQQVMDTYSEKLLAVEDIFFELENQFANSDTYILDIDSADWQDVLDKIKNIKSELKVLGALQQNSILQFASLTNTAVQPANKSL